MDLTYEQQCAFNKLIDDYGNISEYRKKIKLMNYMQFDYAVVHGMTLFMMEPDFDFDALERRTDTILSVLPSIKRIFAQPFIHLKEQDIILPVEAVRVVNNNTLNHISSHSELWSDLKKDEIKPKKLLTKTYEDNYGIYENIVFCNVVDDILAFTRANIRFLKELLYTNQTIEINLLERVNHLNYFLALGKLHVGYSRSFDSYYAVSERCLNKLQFISNSIVPRLKRPVYKNNKFRPVNLKIRKTNILSMHKEYHQIYKFAKNFARPGVAALKEITEADIAELCDSYYFFCQALCIFSIGHFNFTCNERRVFDLSQPMISFKFKNWIVTLEKLTHENYQLISLEIHKDRTYRILLLPSLESDCEEILNSIKATVQADEYIVCSPYEECEKGVAFIDISSLESFRRLQQIILRGMIYSDEKRTECPFCNGKLAVNKDKSTADNPVYECFSCRTEIHGKFCPTAQKTFFYTKIADLKPQYYNDGSWLAKRKAEGKMYFRNITDIDDELEPVCPHCGKAHK